MVRGHCISKEDTSYQNQNVVFCGFEVELILVLLLSQSCDFVMFISAILKIIQGGPKSSSGLVRPSTSLVVVKRVVNWIIVESVVTDFVGIVGGKVGSLLVENCGLDLEVVNGTIGKFGGSLVENCGLDLVVVVIGANGGYHVVSLRGKGFVTFFVDGARFLGSVGLNVEAASGFCQTLPDLEQANASTNNVLFP